MTRAGGERAPSHRFSGRAIQRDVLTDALQHPATLYPFALCAIGASYGVFVAPFLGGQPWPLVLAAVAGLGSLASFTWHYFIRGADSAREKARQVIAQQEIERRKARERELADVRGEVRGAMEELAWADGLKALDRLAGQYEDLKQDLEQADSVNPLLVPSFAASAEETYRAGLTALAHATRVRDAGVEPTNGEPDQPSDDGTPSIEQLLRNAALAAAALRRARLALPALGAPGAADALQEASAALAGALEKMDDDRRSSPSREVTDQERMRN